jgi:hypothetical protein
LLVAERVVGLAVKGMLEYMLLEVDRNAGGYRKFGNRLAKRRGLRNKRKQPLLATPFVTVCDTLSGDDQIQETREEAIAEWGGGGVGWGTKSK